MSDILTLIVDGIINYLLVASVIAAVLTPLAWGIIKVAKIRAPIHRHMVWLYLLIGIMLLPAFWLYGPKLTLAVFPAQVEPAQDAPAEIHSLGLISEETPVAAHASPSRPFPLKAVLACGWLVGIVFMLARLFVGWYRLRRICLSAEHISQNEHFGNMDGRRLRILLTSQVGSPVCFGIFKPVIILPRGLYNNSTPEDLQMVLSHELAHIERLDCWINIFQRVIEAIFFFHPLVWYASFQLAQQREQICDNYVLVRGASATNYAELLSRVIEQGFKRTHLQAVALFEGGLISRVRSLLDLKHSKRIKASSWATIVCAVAVLTCLTCCTLRLEDKPVPDSAGTEMIEADTTEPGPRINFEKTFHHFGKVEPKTNNFCEFKFTNKGDDLLKIQKVWTSCTCTVATVSRKEYVPGETGTVQVKFKAGGGAGLTKKHIYIASNDKNNPKFDLIIKAHIVLKVDHEPKKLNLSLKEKNAGCPKITLSSRDGRPFAIRRFKSTGDCITADYDSSVNKTKFTLQPKVDIKKLRGNLNGRIDIDVTHPECNTITIAFDALPEFEASPPSIVIFDAEPQKPIIKEVWVFSNYGSDFQVLDVRMEKCCIVKLLSQEKIDNRYKLKLEITPTAVKGKERYFTDMISVPIRGERFEIININCRGFYSRGEK
jgi:beta-lactamase regulating signal transducer with metallopeptidase domain